MKEKKKIDELFQEKLKYFEVVPEEAVWDNIKATLESRKKHPLPIWVKLSGIAALLLLGLFLGKNWFFTPSPVPPENPNIVLDHKLSPKDSTKKTLPEQHSIPKSIVHDEQSKKIDSPSEINVRKKRKKEEIRQQQERNSVLVKSPQKSQIDSLSSLQKPTVQEQKQDIQLAKAQDHPEATEKKQKGITKNSSEDLTQKKSLLEEIAHQKDVKAQEQKTSKESIHRISIRPNVAPVYYSSISGGSALDPQFSDHKTKGKVTASYGINVNYALSKKIKLRSGINKVNLSYNTPDIAYTPSAAHLDIKALAPKKEAFPSAVVSSATKNPLPSAKRQSSQNAIMASAYTEGEFHQELSYLEVPVEMIYTVMENRFSIDLIGGTSLLFLDNDKISLSSAVEKRELGSATNVNPFSFTANIGVGFNYQLTQTLNFNVEPIFKYQFSGYKGSTGGFRPYYLGLYSGISIKF